MAKGFVAVVLSLVVGAFLPACGTTSPGNTFFDLSLSANTLTVPAGNVGSVILTVIRLGNFGGALTVSSDNLACSVSPMTVASAQNETTVTCSSSMAGTTNVKITGDDSSGDSASIVLTFVAT